MSRFEEYRPRARGGESPEATAHHREQRVKDLVVRPAVLDDLADLVMIQAAREGGDVSDHAARLRDALDANRTTPHGTILVAEIEGKLAGLAKTTYFKPAADAPENVAPAGWYLSGVIVSPEHRRKGIGRSLTRARLDWIAKRDRWVYYFANARNQVSIDLHREFGFEEITRDFTFPGVTFDGGVGILFRVNLSDGER
ncbi:MAG: GNAT family N-acetyltransferase [Candidatus Eisenbacteria bacterium]|uniref:GNAT family N-acetyltransferase n=1 Tax=Eiseniibacteriota bacterium TaxID=2212470 RepID=A0A956LZL1_UNCEI|nr:GNAT family N-acetyltransferase [Candidatus Eisenbacteria bacterium]